MKLTLNTKRIVFLGIAFFVLGALLFLSGMVVGSGATPDMPDAQIARASNTIDPALPVENIKEPDLLLKVPEMTSEQAEPEKSPAPKSDSAAETPPEPVEKPAPEQAENAEAQTPADSPEKEKSAEKTETAQAEPPAADSPEKEKPGAEDSKKDPATEPAPAPKNSVASSPKIPDRPSFTIQVGAFLDKKNAESLAGTLKERGYSPYILTMWDMMKRQWHIVRLGDYPTQKTADDASRDFMMKERMAATVRGVGLL